MKSAEVLRRLREDGWRIVRTSGSHRQLRHAQKKGTVTVPHPKRDLPVGTLKSIEKQSGVSMARAQSKRTG